MMLYLLSYFVVSKCVLVVEPRLLSSAAATLGMCSVDT